MKSDTFQMSLLFDFYGELLSPKQKELFDLYYNEDMSLTEIAEHAGITRQGVRDAIVRGELFLRTAEDKLGFVRRYSGLESKLDQISEAAGYIASLCASGVVGEVPKWTDKITNIINEIR